PRRVSPGRHARRLLGDVPCRDARLDHAAREPGVPALGPRQRRSARLRDLALVRRLGLQRLRRLDRRGHRALARAGRVREQALAGVQEDGGRRRRAAGPLGAPDRKRRSAAAPHRHDLEARRVTFLLIRPDSWNLPLFVHVAGAMAVTAALVTAVGSLILAWRATGEERAAIT